MQAAMEMASMKGIAEAQTGARLSAPALSAELLRLGLQPVVSGRGSGQGQDDEEASAGSLTPNFITAALNIHKWILSSPACVELLMGLESRWGTRSPFHKVTILNALAMKPSSAKSRQWILESIHDQLCQGLMKAGDVTKSTLVGDRHHCGFVSLFELKQKDFQQHLFFSGSHPLT